MVERLAVAEVARGQRLEVAFQLAQVAVDVATGVAGIGELVRLHERHLHRAGGVGRQRGEGETERKRDGAGGWAHGTSRGATIGIDPSSNGVPPHRVYSITGFARVARGSRGSPACWCPA